MYAACLRELVQMLRQQSDHTPHVSCRIGQWWAGCIPPAFVDRGAHHGLTGLQRLCKVWLSSVCWRCRNVIQNHLVPLLLKASTEDMPEKDNETEKDYEVRFEKFEGRLHRKIFTIAKIFTLLVTPHPHYTAVRKGLSCNFQ